MNGPNILANTFESAIVVGLALLMWLKRRNTNRIARRKEAEVCRSTSPRGLDHPSPSTSAKCAS